MCVTHIIIKWIEGIYVPSYTRAILYTHDVRYSTLPFNLATDERKIIETYLLFIKQIIHKRLFF